MMKEQKGHGPLARTCLPQHSLPRPEPPSVFVKHPCSSALVPIWSTGTSVSPAEQPPDWPLPQPNPPSSCNMGVHPGPKQEIKGGRERENGRGRAARRRSVSKLGLRGGMNGTYSYPTRPAPSLAFRPPTTMQAGPRRSCPAEPWASFQCLVRVSRERAGKDDARGVVTCSVFISWGRRIHLRS